VGDHSEATTAAVFCAVISAPQNKILNQLLSQAAVTAIMQAAQRVNQTSQLINYALMVWPIFNNQRAIN
jgi:hypothetical protein